MTPHDFDWSVDPVCAYGYSESQLREQFGDKYPAFQEYMLMKANPICRGASGAAPSSNPTRSCTEAHGHVFYIHDVIRFVEHRGAS